MSDHSKFENIYQRVNSRYHKKVFIFQPTLEGFISYNKPFTMIPAAAELSVSFI